MDVWTWLNSCRTCGEVHQWRWTCPHPHEHGAADAYRCEGGTWAAQDGHIYQRRLMRSDPGLEVLKREYEASRRQLLSRFL